ncbi:MAG: DUF2752 domain-containing protein [Bacteroidetes bacterium]|nr:DUF2752 domain-containing protein [Bacteroidota bacterium]
MDELISWLEQHQMPCSWKRTFGIDCPGCGMQSAFIELLKGNLVESIKIFPALIPMITMILFLIFHLVFRFQNGARILLFLLIFTVCILVISYLYKISTFIL